jgi:uncharacterized alkaline shock family protein YloU
VGWQGVWLDTGPISAPPFYRRLSDKVSYRCLGKGPKGGSIVTTTRDQQGEQHPLQSDLGTTTIKDPVVVTIAAIATQEVDGVHLSHGGTRLPGDSSPTLGEFLGSVTGGQGRARGISVEVGERQAAIDLTMNVDYGRPIAQVTESVRQNVIRRVESLTGLEVTEVNITVNDVNFPEQ